VLIRIGHFGKVYLARLRSSTNPFVLVLKCLPKEEVLKEGVSIQVRREIEVGRSTRTLLLAEELDIAKPTVSISTRVAPCQMVGSIQGRLAVNDRGRDLTLPDIRTSYSSMAGFTTTPGYSSC
jgi:hypothetical protein